MSLGELAHIVGQKNSPESPRGLAPYSVSKRDLAENILLACGDCHAEIDDPISIDLFTVEKLRQAKRNHEERIKHVTGLGYDRRTVVLRMVGMLRGRPLELSQRTAVEAVIASSDRFPYFKLSYDRVGVEIDLRRLAGESPPTGAGSGRRELAPTSEYYEAAKSIIDETIDGVLNDGLQKGHVGHVSVFAWTRLPLLVYLGRKLGDGYTVDLYQRHQVEDSWAWAPGPLRPVEFTFDTPPASDGAEGVLLASVSGTVHESEIPSSLRNLPIFRISAAGEKAAGGIIDSKATLAAFRKTLREFFGNLERSHKNVTRLHLFGALPMSAAIALGRVREVAIQPAIVTYDRVEYGVYEPAIEIR
ncbi:SAVED domain-containing protein [Micromonospora sp. AMSO12t]|uniref:SAVED domain-containing protein n=1 Tax=Micromonospora sp. AMSO12t TaxID=2650410 RepID=UPI001788D84F|nr:SAVED domain-containing protein [Micromonospora sp. AMSO12t]